MAKQSYSEWNGQGKFNWNEFLSKEIFTENELISAVALAKNWVTCACGNQCSVIPRMAGGCPEDYELTQLGYSFHNAIVGIRHAIAFEQSGELERQNAKEILKAIELRSKYLIKKINNDPNHK